MLYYSMDRAGDYAEIVVEFFDHAYDALAPGQLTLVPAAPTATSTSA